MYYRLSKLSELLSICICYETRLELVDGDTLKVIADPIEDLLLNFINYLSLQWSIDAHLFLDNSTDNILGILIAAELFLHLNH